MLTHKDIWRGVDKLAESFGYSPSGLAKKAGLDPTSFNKSKRISPDGKPRWPSTESISKILSVTEATMSDFISFIDADAESQNTGAQTKSIPVIGFAQAGSDGYFDEDGYPAGSGWDEIEFPQAGKKHDSGFYALQVNGDSMEPLFRKKDLLIVSPIANIRRGDRVVAKLASGEVVAKELSKKTANKVELKSLNPAHKDLSLSKNEIDWMARIMWVSQ